MTPSRSRAGSLAGAIGLWFLLPGAWLLACLPASTGLAVGRRIGDLLWWLMPGRRRLTLDNLHRALGHERTAGALRRLGRRSFQHVGMNLVEGCRYFLRPTDVMISRVRVEGGDQLKTAAAEGRGVPILTAHYGNWSPGRTRWAALIAGAALVAVGGAMAAEPDVAGLVQPYQKGIGERAVGIVAAKAYVEPSRGSAEPTPQSAVSLVLLPYSAAFETELDAVKAGLRDSVDSYTRAVGGIEAARIDYERALVAVGAGDLVKNEATDARGLAEVTGLPAGDWILLAWREGGHQSKQHKVRDQDAKRYPDIPSSVTYSMVTYWRSRITVRNGETVEVSLSDRNVWMTAPRQEGGTPKPPRPATPKKRR